MDLSIFHSLQEIGNPYAHATDPYVFSGEVQLWRPGVPGATSEWTREQFASYVFPAGSSLALLYIDALAIDPAFVGDDPTFFDMFWSDRLDRPTANDGGYLDGDVVRYRRDGTKEVLIDEATVRSVLGIAPGFPINTEDLAILPNGDLLVTLEGEGDTPANPNFGGNRILVGDVVVIPAARAPNSGYWAYRPAELGAFIANAAGPWSSPILRINGIEIDPNGNGARPNPHLPATTRPDMIFQADYTDFASGSGSVRNHIFSTRANGPGNGAIVRDARTFGYGCSPNAGLPVVALAVPRQSPATNAPVTDAYANATGPTT